jgi:protein ImuB
VHVFAAGGDAVTVDERGVLSAAPLEFGASGRLRRVTAWAGPWIVDERWWDAQTRQRASRFQLVDDDGIAWLLAFTDPHWIAEARYD